MATEFYSLEEAADVMGVSTRDVQQMVTQGRLQSHEADGKTVFKIEDVERIVANEGSSIVDLDVTAHPAGELPELAVPEPTSDINLLGLEESSVDLDLGPSPAIETKPPAKAPKPPAAPAKPPEPAGANLTGEDSTIALADSSELDIGLSASDVIALDEAIDKPVPKEGSKAGTKAGTKTPAINVFDEADLHTEADPLAKTQISPVAE